MENELKVLERGQKVFTIESREVSEIIKKEHSKLLRDIRTYCGYLAEANIGLGKYFIESTYFDTNNQERPCYLLSKMGCEMVANKLTGSKGIVFTAKYVEKFNEMEKYIQQENQFKLPHTYKEALLQLVQQVEENEKLQEQIQIQAPKVDNYDLLMNSESAIDFLKFSKMLDIKGMGRNNLMKYLRKDKKILMSDYNRRNVPYERFKQYFEVIEMIGYDDKITYKTLVKPIGQEYIVKLLKKDEYIN